MPRTAFTHSCKNALPFYLDICIMRRMSKEIHKRSYDAAVKELSELMENREMLESELEAVDSKILKLQWAVRGVGNLCNANPETEYPHLFRSEERRVGKECRSRWSPYH